MDANRFFFKCGGALAWSSCLLLAAWLSVANAQSVGVGLRSTDPRDDEHARLLGVLTYTCLTLNLQEVSAREAFQSLGQAIRAQVIGRYEDDRAGHGIDPNLPISIDAQDQTAIDVLEEMLEQCEVHEDCAWQLRKGMIEVGTKRRLAARSAREVRSYTISDLLLEPPYFVGPKDASCYAMNNSPYVEALLGEATRACVRQGATPPRKSAEQIVEEMIELITETIEPGHWDVDEDGEAPAAKNPQADSAAVKKPAPHDPQWASIRVRRDQLIVTAPDFMQRQIGGYPEPIRPKSLDNATTSTLPQHR